MKFLRNFLLPVAVAMLAAGCGDDVTVTDPPVPVYGIRSVTVTPNNVTVAVNKTVQMVASVVTDPGSPTVPTVAWSSSDVAVATVSSVGLVTGKAKGPVAVTATATMGTSTAAGSATLTVTEEVILPATVSINSINQANGTPADLANVSGTIITKLNLDRGGEQVTKVQLLVDGAVVSEQTFGSVSAEAMLASSIEEINMPWNTTTYVASTGQVNWLNGLHTLSAKVVSVQNTTGTASPSVKLTLNNADMFTGTLSSALSANTTTGTKWSGGDISSNLVYVGYSGKKVANISGWILGGGGQGAFTNTAPTTGQTWALTLADASFAPYTSAASEGTFVSNVVYTDGSTVGAFGVVTNKLLVDNTPPTNAPIAIQVPSAVDNLNPVGAWGSNWINGTTAFSKFNVTADAAVGGVTSKFYYIAGALPASACDLTGMTLASTGVGGNLPATTVTSYRAKVVSTDALQNTACANMHGGNLFGVDVVNPSFTLVSGPTNGTGYTAVPTTGLTVLDNAAGFTATPVAAQIRRATVGATTFDVPVLDNSPSTNLYRAMNTVFPSTDGVNGGYYQRLLQVLDQAGNVADAGSIVYLWDNTPATVVVEQAPVAVGLSTTFQVVVNDDMDLKDIYGVVTWPGYGLRQPVQNIGTFGLPYLIGNQTVSYVVNNFVRCFGGYTSVGTPVTAFTSRVRDFVQSAYTSGAGVGISGAVVGTCTVPFNTTGLTSSSFTQTVSPSTITVVLTGVAATSPSFADPFARVEVWVETGTGSNEYSLVGTASGGVLSTTSTSRSYTWTFGYSVPSGRKVFAVGVTSTGMGAKIAEDLMP
jgi:hypothetical protein